MVRTHSQTGLGMRPKHSLVSRPPPFFVLQFPFSIIHGSGVLYYTEHKPKNKKQGRPGNKASQSMQLLSFLFLFQTPTHTYVLSLGAML